MKPKMKPKMKTKKKTNHRQRRKTHARRRVKRGGGGGGLHQLIQDEKQLFNLLNVSGLTPPESRKTSVMVEQVLQMLETRMLLLKQYNDVHGFIYIDQHLRSCIPREDEPNKHISPSIHNIVQCFGDDSTYLPYIKAGFDAESRLHKHITDFIAEIRRIRFIAVMQYEFTLFGGSYDLGNALWATMNRIHELHPDVAPSLTEHLREIIPKVSTAIRDIMQGVRSQIHLLQEIKTKEIPVMEKAYKEKGSDEWQHVLWETIPAFLHPEGDEAEFTKHMERFKRKIDVAISQKQNAMDPNVVFVDPLDLTQLSYRTRPPSHAVAQTVADIASYDPDITTDEKMRLTRMNAMRRSLIHKLTKGPGQLPIDHAKLQSNFYQTNP